MIDFTGDLAAREFAFFFLLSAATWLGLVMAVS